MQQVLHTEKCRSRFSSGVSGNPRGSTADVSGVPGPDSSSPVVRRFWVESKRPVMGIRQRLGQKVGL